MDASVENKNNSHTFLITFSWAELSPSGGHKVSVLKKVLKAFKDDSDLEEFIDNFLKNDECGYRKNIALIDVKRI